MTPLTLEQVDYILDRLGKDVETFAVPMTHGNYDVQYAPWGKVVALLHKLAIAEPKANDNVGCDMEGYAE